MMLFKYSTSKLVAKLILAVHLLKMVEERSQIHTYKCSKLYILSLIIT